MFCSQCGIEISEPAKFCSNCGSPIPESKTGNFTQKSPSVFDAVEDIQKKLNKIDSRQKPPTKKGNIIRSTLDVVKGESSVFALLFDDDFESKKIEDKKQLILNYPLPSNPKALANFAKYINSEITLKQEKPDELTETWKIKLKQIHRIAKSELSATKEFTEIHKYQKESTRKERQESNVVLVVIIGFATLLALILSILHHLPFLLFISICAAGWEIFFILYIHDLLDSMIAFLKQRGKQQKYIPKVLRVVAWYLLVPTIAALITSIVNQSIGLIVLFSMLLLMDTILLGVTYDSE